jgi:hypothetical protein
LNAGAVDLLTGLLVVDGVVRRRAFGFADAGGEVSEVFGVEAVVDVGVVEATVISE